jgi:hypothetical protein
MLQGLLCSRRVRYATSTVFEERLGNAESLRACELLCAFADHQITTRELDGEMGSLTPETVQVTATILSCWAGGNNGSRERLLLARYVCTRQARRSRVLN